ncbi:hypothetical protein ACLKA7_011361 [Drosophila subpalustris]
MGKSEKKSKKKLKDKRKEHKEKHKKSKKHGKNKLTKEEAPKIETPNGGESAAPHVDSGSEEDFAIPIALMNSKSHAPETPEEYQRRQSQIRREVDPVTGRTRLIKGDSEILEEIVSKNQHRSINKKATSGDGEYYESQSQSLAKRQKPN